MATPSVGIAICMSKRVGSRGPRSRSKIALGAFDDGASCTTTSPSGAPKVLANRV